VERGKKEGCREKKDVVQNQFPPTVKNLFPEGTKRKGDLETRGGESYFKR